MFLTLLIKLCVDPILQFKEQLRYNNMVTIQSISHSETDSVKNLLQLSGLPYSDLDEAPAHFFGVKENDQLIATGALEIYGVNAVLRSVAVHEAYQNMGYGLQIVRFLENKAIEKGIKHLFLLTITATEFFKKLGYLPQQRDLCPPEILSSAQFREICPLSASCLSKKLQN